MDSLQLSDWVTVAMAAFTAWMAWETRRMAKVAAESLRASREPHLSLHAVDFVQATIAGPVPTAGQLGAQITLQLKNPGQVRINYDVEVADLVLGGIAGPRGPYDNHAGVIFPGDVHPFRLPAMPLAAAMAKGTTGTLSFRVRYWSEPNERRSLDLAIAFVISTDVQWVYQRGPAYA